MTNGTQPTGCSQPAVEAAIEISRLIAILRLDDHSRVLPIAVTLAENGVRLVEITLEHSDSLRSVERVSDALGDSVIVGAGTVLSSAMVVAARDAGARFCISPHTDAEILATAERVAMLPIPGALTPTEIVRAQSLGAPFVKLFPASAVGPSYLKALVAPLRQARIIPTGGVTISDAGAWFRAGAVAVALGSDLVDRAGTLDGLAERARRAVEVTKGEARG